MEGKGGRRVAALARPWDAIRRGILSESFAWACQNALGLIFAVLFSLVDRMTFTLACICAALYGASSQVLSLDRTIGGRLFAGTIFVGTVLSGGIVGFAVVSLSWLARGDGVKGVLEFLPSELEQVPDRVTLGEFKVAESYLQQYLLAPAGELISLVDTFLKSPIGRRIEEALPVPLPSPTQVIDDVQTLIEGFEEQVPPVDTAYWVLLIILYFVLSFPFAFSRGMVKSYMGLVLAIATLFFSSQVVFGSLMPIFGQRLFWTQVTGGYCKVALINVGAMMIAGMIIFVRSAHDSVRQGLGSVMISCGKNLTEMASSAYVHVVGKDGDSDVKTLNDNPYMDEVIRMAQPKNRVKKGSVLLQVETFNVESSLVSCLFEPPLPGLVSQPGQNRFKYELVLKGLKRIISIISNLETSYADGTQESREILSHDEFATSVNMTLASVAAILQRAAVVLQDMPVFKKCHGESLSWRPEKKDFYREIEANLTQVYELIRTSSLGYPRVPENLVKGSSALLTLTSCTSLLEEVEILEQLLCDALEIPTDTDAKVTEEKIVQKKSVKDLILMDSWAPSFVMHSCLLSGLLAWALMAQGMKLTYDYSLGSLSKIPWRKKREVHFALKYWIGMTLAVMGIILIFWLGKGDDQNPVQGYGNMADFFFNWQPVYFTITAAICTQMQVESSAGKAVLRTTMTFLGGFLGYLTMLNGSLAQNPYFLTCISCLVNGACGLLSPMKELRYSLFLTAFTFNAVVICQYYGCCSLAGEAINFGGKVVSTMLGSIYAILISWCFLPYYTSEKMLELESSAMEDGVAIVKSTLHSRTSGNSGRFSDKRASRIMDTVVHKVYAPLSDVVKEYKMNTIDKKQFLLLTYTLLPTPPVVIMILESLARMSSYLHESANLMKRFFSTTIPDTDAKITKFVENIQNELDDVLDRATETSKVCSEAMLAKSPSVLKQAREDVRAKNLDLAEARVRLSNAVNDWFSKNAIDASSQNISGLMSLQLLLNAVREVQVTAYILSDVEEATDRDYQFSWLSSWFGRRPLM